MSKGGMSSSSSSSQAQHNMNSSRDLITDIDNGKHLQEWSYSIIDAMAKIQTQFAIEQGLDKKLPKDYFTDSDKLKFFWSGFSNSSFPQHFMDVIFHSIFNWEFGIILFVSLFTQVIIFSSESMSYFAHIVIAIITYISAAGYSIYIISHTRYFTRGDLSSRMILLLAIGRLLFLLVSATVLSSFFYYAAEFFYNNPQTLQSWTNSLYWLFDITDNAYSFLGSKKDFFNTFYENVLPQMVIISKEIFFVFSVCGILPFTIFAIKKIVLVYKKSKDIKKFKGNIDD